VKTNLLTWIGLLGLTLTSFLARDQFHGRAASTIIFTMAGIKCSTLGWNFMELRVSHWFWRAVLLTMIVAVLLIASVIARRG
jgi:hypothetical protein